jgi:hypothetical protein
MEGGLCAATAGPGLLLGAGCSLDDMRIGARLIEFILDWATQARLGGGGSESGRVPSGHGF